MPSKKKIKYLRELREKAEDYLGTLKNKERVPRTEEAHALSHELQVSQVELDMQVEELFRTRRHLKKTREAFDRLYHRAPVGFATLDEHGKILKCNAVLATLLGGDPADLPGLELADFVHPEAKPLFLGRFRSFFRQPDGNQMTLQLGATAGGKPRDRECFVSLSGQQGGDGLNGADTLLVAVADATLDVRHERELALASKVFNNSMEGILITDSAGTILQINRAFSILTGYREREVLGKNASILRSNSHDAAFFDRMWRDLAARGTWQGEIVNRRKDGDTFTAWLSIGAVADADGRPSHYVGNLTDISEKKVWEQQVEQLAYYDSLTGLPNRALCLDRLRQARVRAQRNGSHLAILFLDLDGFEELKDTHGGAAGDAVLQQVASRLMSTMRRTDTVSRMGEDEFTVVLADIRDPEHAALEASKVAANILKGMDRPFDLFAIELQVSASVGIALFPEDGDEIGDLVVHAETAMRQARQQGPNRYCFYSQQLFEAQQEKANLKRDLYHALEREEFVLHYQPQVSLASNAVLGFEALIRWNHPQRGLIPPGYFVGLAEQAGLIQDIGTWVLRTACRQAVGWHDAGWDGLYVAVNLSPYQVKTGSFPAQIERILVETGLPPQFLEVEVTETAMMDDTVQVSETLSRLRSLGVKVSLDDFGTGYSSLAYVKHFPVQALKIDRSFVGDLFLSLEDKSIVLASLSLARNLGVRTVAEGVETEAQRAFLAEAGCDCIQGPLISTPLPADRIEGFLTSWTQAHAVET